jgi:cytoskeleton protein RodZ
MSDNQPHAPAADAPIAGPASPGAILRARREEAGLSLVTVGEALHLTGHYIKALEGDEYGKLPGLTFVKGYLRSYARYVNADVDMVLACFDQHIASLVNAGIRTGEVQRSRQRQDQALRWAFVTGFIIVAGVAGGWWYKGQDDMPSTTASAAPAVAPLQAIPPPVAAIATRQPVPNATLPTPAAVTTEIPLQYEAAIPTPMPAQTVQEAETATVGAADMDPATNKNLSISAAANGARRLSLSAGGGDVLQLDFNGNSWVEIDDGGRVRLYNDMLRAGDALTVQGEAPFFILLGDARQVDIHLNSAAVDIAPDIRPDSTARLVLDDAFANDTPAVEAGVAN